MDQIFVNIFQKRTKKDRYDWHMMKALMEIVTSFSIRSYLGMNPLDQLGYTSVT
jgi:hypothetical protein